MSICENADHSGIQQVLCGFSVAGRADGVDQSVAVERVADLLSVPIKTLYQWVNQAESQTVSQAPAFDAEGNRCRRRGCRRGSACCWCSGGELGESEALGRRAAEAGNTAAEAGDAPTATGLSLLLEQRGDLANAEIWWRRAAEAGDTATAAGLAVPLERRGELDEAVRWYRTAAEAGNMAAAARPRQPARTARRRPGQAHRPVTASGQRDGR